MSNQSKTIRTKSIKTFAERIDQVTLYLYVLPGMVLMFLFNYLPLYGVLIPFKKFNFQEGILGSSWQNPVFNNFSFLFSSEQVFRATKNTILLNFTFIFSGTAAAVILALLLNELRSGLFKKFCQSATFLPYFISWIVVSVFTYNIFDPDRGIINQFLAIMGIPGVDWYSSPEYWPAILAVVNIWKGVGYGSIVYLATLSGIDFSYYEASEIDGANRFQKIIHITIPMILPTIITLMLLSLGRIMNADFGMFYAVIGDNPVLYPTTDVLDTYIFRTLRILGDIGMSSAANVYQSTIAFILVLLSNKIAKRWNANLF